MQTDRHQCSLPCANVQNSLPVQLILEANHRRTSKLPSTNETTGPTPGLLLALARTGQGQSSPLLAYHATQAPDQPPCAVGTTGPRLISRKTLTQRATQHGRGCLSNSHWQQHAASRDGLKSISQYQNNASPPLLTRTNQAPKAVLFSSYVHLLGAACFFFGPRAAAHWCAEGCRSLCNWHNKLAANCWPLQPFASSG
jgi:hypothetical protein